MSRGDIARIAIVALGAAWSWIDRGPRTAGVDPVPLLVLAVGGYPIARETYEALRSRRMTMELSMTIMVNFVGTLAVDAAGLLLAAFGLLAPLAAAFIHVASELAFILNSARLLPLARGATPGRRTAFAERRLACRSSGTAS